MMAADNDIYGHDEAIAAIEDDARWMVDHLGEHSEACMDRYGFWGIMNRRDEVVVPAGFPHDRVEWFDDDCCESYDAKDLVEWLHEENPDMLDDAVRDVFDSDPSSVGSDVIGDAYGYLMSMDDSRGHPTDESDRDCAMARVASLAAEWLGFDEQCIHEVWGLEPDRLFLTREDAERHIKENHYHYAKGARPYYIAAWRSPRLCHLIDALCALGGAPYDPGCAQQTLPGLGDM